MKVLTIKEPWATLIINGIKEYEFRTWKTNYRGKLLIHAGKGKEINMFPLFKDYNLNYSYGEIIGEVALVDCILVDEKMDKELKQKNKKVYGNNHVGDYAWKLANPIIYKDKIKINGKLGLWNYNEKEFV
jgi:hypothetical protein